MASDDKLNRLIAEYLHAEQAGNPPDQQELIDQHPDLADSLRAFFSNHDRMQEAADAPTMPPNPQLYRGGTSLLSS